MSVEILVIASALVMLSCVFQYCRQPHPAQFVFCRHRGSGISPDTRRQTLLRNFRAIVQISTPAAVVLELSTGLILLALLIQTVGYLCALVDAHHKALAFAAPSESTVEVDLAAPLEFLGFIEFVNSSMIPPVAKTAS